MDEQILWPHQMGSPFSKCRYRPLSSSSTWRNVLNPGKVQKGIKLLTSVMSGLSPSVNEIHSLIMMMWMEEIVKNVQV